MLGGREEGNKEAGGCKGATAAEAEEFEGWFPPGLSRVLPGGPVGLWLYCLEVVLLLLVPLPPAPLLGCEGLLLLGLKKVEAERGGVGARGCRDAKLKRDALPLGLVDAGTSRALA